MRELHLYAGAGGGILGGVLLGHRCVGAVEIDPYCRRVLEQRQRDGVLEQFPIFDDVRTFDGRPWRGRVDVVCGGFPCQDISNAGRREGLDGDRSSLWWEMHRVVREVEPAFVFVENVAALLVRGFDRVLGSLADLGFDAEWCVLSAAQCGAPHLRQRLWLLAAHSDRYRKHAVAVDAEVARASEPPGDPDLEGLEERQSIGSNDATQQPTAVGAGWWCVEPRMGRVADGVAHRVDRLRAIGNGQVASVAAAAFRFLLSRFTAEKLNDT